MPIMPKLEGWTLDFSLDADELVPAEYSPDPDPRRIMPPPRKSVTLTLSLDGVTVFVMRSFPDSDDPQVEISSLSFDPDSFAHPLVALIEDANEAREARRARDA